MAESKTKSGPPAHEPVLTLAPPQIKYRREQTATFKLRVSPTDNDSALYEMVVPFYDGTGTLQECIHARVNLRKVFVGLNANTGADQDRIAQQLLKGVALESYEAGREKRHLERWDEAREVARAASEGQGENARQQAAAAAGAAEPDLHVEDVLAGLNMMVTAKAPHKALQKAKRDVRRRMRKPAEMTIRDWWAHIQRIVTRDLLNLPPDFEGNVSIQADELMDILLYSIPQSWVREMDKFDLDPFASASETLAFCERMEASEEHDKSAATQKKSGSGNNNNKAKKAKKNNNKGSDSYYCQYHGSNNTHNTDECHVVKKLIASAGQSSGSKNKTWSRKKDGKSNKGGDDKKKTDKKELAAFIKQSVRKELNTVESRKRKSTDDDDEDLEANLAEMDFDVLSLGGGSDLNDDEVSV